tara:strand:- start:212 stop:601 length:390 start_codon:yes stop_codon:yes gene_type:complete
MDMRQTFCKAERLKSKIVFEELMTEGHSVKKYPFVLVWKRSLESLEFPIEIAFSVSKKRFPKAVDRNEIKRKIREVYRRNKFHWHKKLSDSYSVLLIYTSKQKMDLDVMQNKLILVFERFISDVFDKDI